MKRAGIYTRLSLADENSTSTTRQKKECEDHAKSLGLEVVKVFNDEGISGFKDVERPEFDEAIEALVRGDFDTLIVWKLDRLTRRGMGHIGTLLDRLDGSGRRIVSKMDGIDTSQSHGRIMVALLSEMARSESANTSLRLKAERREAREVGRISCGKPPWGMMRLPDGKIAPDPETAPIAREVIDRFLAGEKRLSIVRWLNQEEHVTSRGAKWSDAALARWLTFPTLAGFVSHNPDKNRIPDAYRSAETGEIVVVGEGIITEAEFYEIRSKMRPRRSNPKGGRKGGRALSGLLTCGKCGSRMYASKVAYYCSGMSKGLCKNSIRVQHLEPLIADYVITRLCALEPGHEIHEKVENVWKGDGSDHRVEELQNSAVNELRLIDLQSRMTALMEDRYSRGAFDGQEDLFDKLRTDLQLQIDAQKEKCDASPVSKGRQSHMSLTDSEIVRDAWESTSDLDKQAVTKAVVEKITILPFSALEGAAQRRFHPERVEIEFIAA